MIPLRRTMSGTFLTASSLILAGAVSSTLFAPSAAADTPDQFLYPQTGHVYIDPTMVRVLSAVSVDVAAGSAGDALVTLSGPSTTVAVLSTVEHVINGPVRQAAGMPGAGVDVNWTVGPGGVVFNTTEIR